MLLDGERWEPISSQYQIIVSKQHCFNTDTILLAHFASPKRKDCCADLVQAVAPFLLSGVAGICQDIFMQ